jgi:hypothetical protein
VNWIILVGIGMFMVFYVMLVGRGSLVENHDQYLGSENDRLKCLVEQLKITTVIVFLLLSSINNGLFG